MSDLFELRSEQRSGRSAVDESWDFGGCYACLSSAFPSPEKFAVGSLTSHVALNEEKS